MHCFDDKHRNEEYREPVFRIPERRSEAYTSLNTYPDLYVGLIEVVPGMVVHGVGGYRIVVQYPETGIGISNRYIKGGSHMNGHLVIHIPPKEEFRRIIEVQPVHIKEMRTGRISYP